MRVHSCPNYVLHPICCVFKNKFKCPPSSLSVFKKELEKDVAGDTSGNFAKLLLALVQVSCVIYVSCFCSL